MTAAAFFNGILSSPLFQYSGFSLGMVVIDALHCLDLCVSQHIVGDIFVRRLTCFSQHAWRDGCRSCERGFVLGTLKLDLRVPYNCSPWRSPTRMLRRRSTPVLFGRALPVCLPFTCSCVSKVALKMSAMCDDERHVFVLHCLRRLCDKRPWLSLDTQVPQAYRHV